MQIGAPKEKLLRAIARYPYLSAPQAARYQFSKGSLTYVRKHLRELYQAGYVQRVPLMPIRPHGAHLWTYILTGRGVAYVRELGIDVTGRVRESEQRERQQLFLRHTMAANELMILAELLPERDPRVQVTRLLTERELKQAPVYVEGDDGKRVGVIPDGWVEFGTRTRPWAIAFELDRGTVSRKSWVAKLDAYAAYIAGPYQQAFETTSLTIAVVTTAGPRRLHDLRTWTKAAWGDALLTDLLLFTALDPEQVEPETLFLGPVWQSAGEGQPVPLVGAP